MIYLDALYQIAFGIAWLPLSVLTFVYDLAVHEWPERRRRARQ